MMTKNIFYEEHAPQATFFMKPNLPQARLIEPNAPRPDFFKKS